MRPRLPSAGDLEHLLAAAKSADTTYREIGTTERDIVSFSRTVDPLARLGSPLARRLQQRVTERYLDATAAAAAAGCS